MQEVKTTLAIGTILRKRYVVKSLVGKGNSGAVYLVEDQRVQRIEQNAFALKEMRGLSKQERYQFAFDSVPLTQLNHQTLPRIHHVFNDDRRSQVCIVMDYVEGPDLETLWQFQSEQRFTWPKVAQMLAPIVDAVSYLHRQKPPIVHGDIKPVNIILAQPDERFMLVDVGGAREHIPDASVLSGTSGYKAPEQYSTGVDVSTDVYGLGATCSALLTGRVPTNALVRAAQLERGQDDPLQPADTAVPAVPSHISRAIHQAMSLNAHERFSSVEEFWQAFQAPLKELKPTVDEVALLTTTVPEQTQVPAAVQTPLLSRRPSSTISPFSFLKRSVVPLVLLSLLLLGGAGIWSLVQSYHPPSSVPKQAVTPHPALYPPVLGSTAPVVTPTSSPSNYPSVVGSYTGILVDISSKASATMILQEVHQIGGTINGYITLGSPLEISGPFRGTIDFSKHFHLTVTDAAGYPVLLLEGAIQSATSLSGDFYRCASTPTQGGKCSRDSDGYGIWSALLVTSTG